MAQLSLKIGTSSVQALQIALAKRCPLCFVGDVTDSVRKTEIKLVSSANLCG